MKKLTLIMILAMLFASIVHAGSGSAPEQGRDPHEERGLTLSDLQVKVTFSGHTATFQLYNTVAARELYELGHAVSGSRQIKRMSGTIHIEKGIAP